MLIFITMQLFQLMFTTTLDGEALKFVKATSFFELFIELVSVCIFVCILIYEKVDK